MTAKMTPTVVTANDLRSGRVVYLSEGGRWAGALERASIAETAAARAALERDAHEAVRRCEVVAVYAMDVEVVDGLPRPTSARERIRAAHATVVNPSI